MKHFRFAVVALGSSIAVAGALLACTSDDTVVTSDDAGVDTGTNIDSGFDTSTDAGTDTGPEDAGADVLIDAGLTFESFRSKLAEVVCKSTARCCFGNPDLADGAAVDGGFYDQDRCRQAAYAGGFEGSLLFDEDAGAPLILNQAQALECLAKLESISCSLGRAEFVATRAACFNSVRGTATVGAACSTGVDCAPGSFCNRATGKCEALRGEDAPCGDFTANDGIANEACSWRSSGDTDRFCDSWDFDKADYRPQAEWRCRSARSNGSRCVNSIWCSDGLCDDRNDVDGNGEIDNVCRSPITYFPRDPNFCGALVKP